VASETMIETEPNDLSVAFRAAVGAFVQEKTGDEVAAVIGWNEYTEGGGGGCDTCGYGSSVDTEALVTYVTTNGKSKTYTYYGKFSDLLSEILNADAYRG
jgi:hypothetical protein